MFFGCPPLRNPGTSLSCVTEAIPISNSFSSHSGCSASCAPAATVFTSKPPTITAVLFQSYRQSPRSCPPGTASSPSCPSTASYLHRQYSNQLPELSQRPQTHISTSCLQSRPYRTRSPPKRRNSCSPPHLQAVSRLHSHKICRHSTCLASMKQ
jgi:hypothetical protein